MQQPLTFTKLCILGLLITGSLGSCFISSRSEMELFHKEEYANSVTVKTIKVPLLLTKPVLKKYLRYEEDVPTDVLKIIKNIKKVKATVALTRNQKLATEFRSAFAEYKGNEWLSVKNNNRWVAVKAEQDQNAIINRLMVAVANPDDGQLVYVNMKCHLTPHQLSTLINFAMDADSGKNKAKKN